MAALVGAATLVGGGTAASQRTAGTLQLDAILRNSFQHVQCPQDVASDECLQWTGAGAARGLGGVQESFLTGFDRTDPNCVHTRFGRAFLSIASKGEIDFTLSDPYTCDPTGETRTLTFDYATTGGSGPYAGATGSGTLANGTTSDRWSGTISVSGLDFDVTPPVISGAHSKTVRIPRHRRRARVNYHVRANDAVDGPVRAKCRPRSGSHFRLGRTRVRCTATDSSANTASRSFRVMVKHRKG